MFTVTPAEARAPIDALYNDAVYGSERSASLKNGAVFSFEAAVEDASRRLNDRNR